MFESTGIGSYFAHNFMGAESNTSYIAGMNFSNLIIAIPIIATILLLISNFIRSKFTKCIPNGLFDCKFMSVTLILYFLISWIFINLLGYQLSIGVALIVIICYILFYSLSWCIYNEFCFTQTYIELDGKDIDSYQVKFLTKIKQKIQEIRSTPKVKNILVNGSWGAGKSYFIESHLKQTPSLLYLSCTDYADTHELITALIEKTNNCLFRWLVRLSITRVLAILGKFELKQFIGINKVIVFDEFERLVDYNKIDPMHIVSLIQYLNNQKNCICILVANDEPLNNNSQFTNVREKLISYTYNYRLPFEEVINITQTEYLKNAVSNLSKTHDGINKDKIKTIVEYNQKAQELNGRDVTQETKKILEIIDLNDSNFDNLKQDIKERYRVDNNIRIIEHLYIKINQIYANYENFVKFKQNNSGIHITNEEYFALLFSNVLDLINPLYHLYLKNPYNLKAIERLVIFYRYDANEKSANAISNVAKNTTEKLKQNQETTSKKEQNEEKNYQYFESSSIQCLALKYINHAAISYVSNYGKTYDRSYDLNFIICNQDFENVSQNLIINYLGIHEIVIQLLPRGEHGNTLSQNIALFMRSFKENFCEDDNPELITDYFKSINVLEQRFLRLVNDDTNSSWDDSIVTDYIAYCKYIDKTCSRDDPNNIRPVSYDRVAYINALIIQTIINSTDNIQIIINQIIDYNKNNKVPYIYELTCIQANNQNKINLLINTIKQIVDTLSTKQYNLEKQLIFLLQSYDELQRVAMLNKYRHDKTIWDEFVNLVNRMANDLIAKQEKTLKVLDFMYNSYNTFKGELLKNNTNSAPQVKELIKNTVILCNKNLISLLTFNRNTQEFINKLFMLLDNFNDDNLMESFKANSLPILVDTIKEIYNTPELLQKFITTLKDNKWETSKQVVNVLEKELNTPNAQNNQETERKE